MKRLLLLIVLMQAFALSAFATGARVLEVQDKVKADIAKFLDKFSPNTKYSIQVKIKPLRRKYESNLIEDNLPFMEFQEDYVVDEWDDPKVSIYSLYNRIAEAKVSIYIEDKVKIEDRVKFKEALLRDVNLVPGRDFVSIEAISTPVLVTAFNWKEQTEILLLGVMLMIAVILGVGLNSLSKRIVPDKVKNVSSEGGAPASVSSPVGGAPSVVNASSAPVVGSRQSNELKGDLQLQDPAKLNEVVSKKINKLMTSQMFPTLADMLTLEELYESDPSGFSYLVYEFPLEIQKSIYQLGRGEKWFKGFSEVGFPSKSVLIALDRMLRERDINHSEKFEKLLIHSWRLGQEFSLLAKKLSKDQAFSILHFLPKNLSIPVARECFPGAWGSVLETNNKVMIRDDSEILDIVKKTLNIHPYLNYESLQVFKNRKDLLTYLDTVEPHEERDIYSVMNKSNELLSVRPAFYRFFELTEEQRQEVFKAFSLNEWALMIFNVERAEKELVTELMNEKERYLFGLALQEIDRNPAVAHGKYQLRQKVARIVADKYEDIVETEQTEETEVDESQEREKSVA